MLAARIFLALVALAMPISARLRDGDECYPDNDQCCQCYMFPSGSLWTVKCNPDQSSLTGYRCSVSRANPGCDDTQWSLKC
ncbi:unnamed protein product [Cercospora beticola]|nr:unnamed protein product [Cercospora beticola]